MLYHIPIACLSYTALVDGEWYQFRCLMFKCECIVPVEFSEYLYILYSGNKHVQLPTLYCEKVGI